MSITEGEVRELVGRVLAQCGGLAGAGTAAPGGGEFPIEASARHVHLTTRAVEALFGPGARRTK